MGEGKEIKLHACRRKPSGMFVGRDGDGWALIRQQSPFTLSGPSSSVTDGLSVLFGGRVLAGGISYCPYCGETLSGGGE